MLLKGSGGTKEDEVPAGIPCVRYGDLYTSHEYFILKARSFVSSAKAKEYTPIKFGDVALRCVGRGLHSAIGYIAPLDFMDGKATQIWSERDRKLEQARKLRRERRANKVPA